MTTLKMTTLKTGPLAAKHLDVRLRKIRSFKTSSLKTQPPKIVLATVRAPKPFLKSIVPYGLVIASLALCTGATATAAQAKTAQHPAHAVTHAVRQRVPAQQPDFVAQFFQGLFGGRGVPVRASRGAPDESTTWVEFAQLRQFGCGCCQRPDCRRHPGGVRRRGAGHPANERHQRDECIHGGGGTAERSGPSRGHPDRNQRQQWQLMPVRVTQ